MKAAPTLAAAALALALAAPASAQMPDSYKQVQQSQLTLQRRSLLSMADSMPERLYRDKATPVQRDFAQQLQHVAGSLGFVLNHALQTGMPGRVDTAAMYTRNGLKAYINASYDWADGILRNQSAADRNRTVSVFGSSMPGWQVWDEMHQHAFWTMGQVVANFRKNNMAPPGFGFF